MRSPIAIQQNLELLNLSSRAWLLLIMQTPVDVVGPMKIADLLESLGQLATLDDRQDLGDENDEADGPCCPHCGSARTTLLGEWPPPDAIRRANTTGEKCVVAVR